MKIYSIRLGSILRGKRQQNDWTLAKTASMLGFCSDVYLWRCEKGKNSFPPKRMKRASELFNIPIDEIIDAATQDYRDSVTKYLKESE